jgi:hypothetical protein
MAHENVWDDYADQLITKQIDADYLVHRYRRTGMIESGTQQKQLASFDSITMVNGFLLYKK